MPKRSRSHSYQRSCPAHGCDFVAVCKISKEQTREDLVFHISQHQSLGDGNSHELIPLYLCDLCGKYWASLSAFGQHRRHCVPKHNKDVVRHGMLKTV